MFNFYYFTILSTNMDTSSLIIALQSLNKQDIRNLRKQLNSPFFNQREDVTIAFEYLIEQIQSKNPDYSKQGLFEVVYQFEKYQDKKIRYLFSFLLDQVETYFAWLEFRSNERSLKMGALKQFRKRGLEKLFLQSSRRLEREGADSQILQKDYHLQQYQFELEKYNFLQQKKRFGDFNIEQIPAQLSYYFLSEIFFSACIALSHQAVSKVAYAIPLLEAACSLAEGKKHDLPPLVNIHYHAYLALSQPENEVHFQKVKNLYDQYFQNIAKEELRDLLILLINICIRRLNSGEKKYIREAFELYQLGLDTKVLALENELPIFTFNNIVNLGLGLKNFDWVYTFIESWHPLLPEKERTNAYQYNLATFHLRTGDLDKAQELLSKVILKDTLYNLDSRRILLKIYFEKGETDALYGLIGSFKTFLSRKKELGYHREMYKNLLYFTEQILKLPRGKSSNRENLIDRIKNTQRLAERDWLIAQTSKF